jgi:hypothetical protein
MHFKLLDYWTSNDGFRNVEASIRERDIAVHVDDQLWHIYYFTSKNM